jgi:hypothetical protein
MLTHKFVAKHCTGGSTNFVGYRLRSVGLSQRRLSIRRPQFGAQRSQLCRLPNWTLGQDNATIASPCLIRRRTHGWQVTNLTRFNGETLQWRGTPILAGRTHRTGRFQ